MTPRSLSEPELTTTHTKHNAKCTNRTPIPVWAPLEAVGGRENVRCYLLPTLMVLTLGITFMELRVGADRSELRRMTPFYLYRKTGTVVLVCHQQSECGRDVQAADGAAGVSHLTCVSTALVWQRAGTWSVLCNGPIGR